MIDTLNTNELQERIYTEYKEKITRYVRGRISNPHEAEDTVSDVFVKIFGGLSGFDENKASLSTWIYAVTRNTVTDHFRKAKQFCEIPDELSGAEDVEESILREETLSRLAKALLSLEPRARDIIVLHYYSGRSLKEAAVMMNISYSYAKLLHSEALKALRVIMEK